ncbi:HAD family hydrolase [Amnibacterium endophyticum]|uniref:HAD family hydrolase n=1 Tax=Amnibacterium endophyticum TaxID=2109337 RepID=A0ABW4LHP1_9MICO
MAPPRLVLFDLDGTLLDGSGLPAAMRRTCEAIAADLPGVSADDLVAANTAAWQRLWPEVEDDWMLGGRDGDAVAAEIWRAALTAVGADDPRLLTATLHRWTEEERAMFRLYDDVLPALDAVEGTGARIGLLTNGAGTVQRRKLAATGLGERFDPLVISGEIGLRKPDPEVFGVALHRASIGAHDAWYVGDNLWHDVAPARAAGLHAVWVDRHDIAPEDGWPRPDAAVTTLAALPALLQEPR